MHLVRWFFNAWLGVLLADGALRLLAGLVQVATGSTLLLLPVGLLDLLLLLMSVAAFALTAFAQQVPRRVVLPPLIAACWLNLGALPFSLALYGTGWMQVAVGLVLVLSVGAAEGLARSVGHGRWGVGDLGEDFDITLRGVAGWFAGWGLIGPVVAALYLVLSLAWAVDWGSRGFVRLTPEGLSFAHKTYVLGDDTVHLVGMVHIGEQEQYDELFARIPEGSLALTEGVSDTQGLLTAPGDAYGRAASAIGLTVQEPIGEIAPLVDRNADVDVSTFDPTTLELLDVVLKIYGSPDNLDKALQEYLAFWIAHQRDAQKIQDQLFDDILDSRNEHLLAELEEARAETDQIVVPWGALHLVGISERLEAEGWTLVDTRRVVIIRWSTLLGDR